LRSVTARQLQADSPSTLTVADASIFTMNFSSKPMSARNGSPQFGRDRNPRRRSSSCECTAQRHGEKGAGHLKAIIWTLILVLIAYVGFKVTPLLINEYEFQDGIQTIARMASVNRPESEKIRQAVLKEAEKDELPIRAEDIQIVAAGGNIHISANYSVTVDLKVYQWTLNFNPSATNNALF
jgi:hypothetical protein